jgi:hypothetical protein
MNAKRKEKGVKEGLSSELKGEELVSFLVAQGYDAEKEVPEIVLAIESGEDIAEKTVKFNASELIGDNFKKYNEELAKINGSKYEDFVLYNAIGVFEVVFDKNKNKVTVLDGIALVRDAPINTTRIEVAAASRFNLQILNTSNNRENSKYFLLKKLINE